MKKYIVVLLVLTSPIFLRGQERKNEVKMNILNAFVITSIELGYERFIDENQALDFEIFFNDRFSYLPAKKGGKFNSTSVKVGYNYYIEPENMEGIYISPFLKYRFGNYTQNEQKSPLSSFILGMGVGYIWSFNDIFVIAPYANIGRNFSTEVNKNFWAIEPNAGIKIGYRF